MCFACYISSNKQRESEDLCPLVSLVRYEHILKQIVYLDCALSVEYAIVTLRHATKGTQIHLAQVALKENKAAE